MEQECPARGDAEAVDLNLLDPAVQACPWSAYKVMRDEGGIYRDPVTGYFIITRYDILREVMEKDAIFNAGHPDGRGKPWLQSPVGQKVLAEWKRRGWAPQAHLQDMSGDYHAQIRSTMSWAFVGKRVRELEEVASDTVASLIDTFIDDGRCDWVSQFAVPLPLYVIGKATGIADEHLPMVLEAVDSYTSLTGMMDTEEQAMAHFDRIIRAQKLFQEMIERFRAAPDGSLISDLVNAVIPEQNRQFDEAELHMHILSAFFVAGAETTRNALAEGMRILAENEPLWLRLKADPEKFVRPFTEEVLRSNSPAQGLFKFAQEDTELQGVSIPRGSMLITRYGAANRDERVFDEPDRFDPDRPGLGRHLAFGAGAHFCLGAQLARTELKQAFVQIAGRLDSVSLAPGHEPLAYHPHFALRGLKSLPIVFTRAGTV